MSSIYLLSNFETSTQLFRTYSLGSIVDAIVNNVWKHEEASFRLVTMAYIIDGTIPSFEEVIIDGHQPLKLFIL